MLCGWAAEAKLLLTLTVEMRVKDQRAPVIRCLQRVAPTHTVFPQGDAHTPAQTTLNAHTHTSRPRGVQPALGRSSMSVYVVD